MNSPTSTPSKTCGQFVWRDLMCRDVAGARAFYSDLFGWTVDAGPGGEQTHTMLLAQGQPVAGIIPLPAEAPEGIPSHWLSYVEVPDMDSCLKRVLQAGGNIRLAPQPMGAAGVYAVIGDPEEATIAVYQHLGDAGAGVPDPNTPGHFAWAELHCKDVDSCKPFYANVFGWEYRHEDMGPMGTYTLIVNGGKDIAGVMSMPPGVQSPSAWMSYVCSDDVDGAYSRALELGASSFVAPADIPAVGRFAVLADAGGAAFSLFCPAT